MDDPVGNDRQQRALGALREERDRALNYLDAVNALILSLDRRGGVTLLKRFGRELLGYSEAELFGRDVAAGPRWRRDRVRSRRAPCRGAGVPVVGTVAVVRRP